VQVKVTIELVGEESEIAPALVGLSELLSGVSQEPDEHESSWWTPERADKFVRDLKPGALHALRVIAAGAPKAPIAHVQRDMKRLGFPLTPGGLSAIGFAVRRHGSPAPFVRDGYQRAYVMDPEVAEVVLAAIEGEIERRRSAE
jgi:hypothetical protein